MLVDSTCFVTQYLFLFVHYYILFLNLAIIYNVKILIFMQTKSA